MVNTTETKLRRLNYSIRLFYVYSFK